MNARRTTLFIAIILAIGTGWLTLNYLASINSQNANANQRREVIVAATEIPARAPITAEMLVKTTRPASAVDPDAITDETQIAGALALITIPTGGVLTASKIGRGVNAALPVRLTPGMRAVSVSIDHVKGVSGLIQPGDRVDVIAVPPRTQDEPPPAATVLRGIRVLAIGEALENASATPSPQEQGATTVTLEVSPTQADILAMADVDTTIRLALRSPQERVNSHPPESLRFPTTPNGPPGGGAGGGAPAAGAPAAGTTASVNGSGRQQWYYPTSRVIVIDGASAGGGNGSSSDEP